MKRLIWNFEIDNRDGQDFPPLLPHEAEPQRWEMRFFWPSDAVIILHGLPDHFLGLAHYQSKHRQDTYYLLDQGNYNIKLRRNELLYKPLLITEQGLQGFGKKINLLDETPTALLPGTASVAAHQLIDWIHNEATLITVNKDAQIYKLDSTPTIKLELSRLQIDEQIYFSACVEGRSQQGVRLITEHILPGLTACDYVHFLKTRAKHD